MKNSFLLPHAFKKIGLSIAPLGFLFWIIIQKKILLSNLLPHAKVAPLAICACAFVFGFFFAVFAKEKIEDEFVNQKRLETLMLATLVQVLLVVVGFFTIGFFQWPATQEGTMFYFIGCIFFYYVFYLVRFNYCISYSNRYSAS